MLLRSLSFVGLILLMFQNVALAQRCNEKVIASTPNERFEILGDEVRDLQTNLTWQRCTLGQSWNGDTCAGIATDFTWQGALLSTTGSWRLPNIKELASIVEFSCFQPAINLEVFPSSYDGVTSRYWSSTRCINCGYASWVVNFGNVGSVSYTQTASYVRLVKE